MTRAMTMIQQPFARAFDAVRGITARLGIPSLAIPAEVSRTALAGAILLGVAGAGMGFSGGVGAFPVEKTAAGVSVKLYWGYAWMGYAAMGLLAGAVLGAGVTYLLRFLSRQKGARMALLAIGALGGMTAGMSWGEAVARERQFEVRAQQPFAKSVNVPRGAEFNVVNGPVRLHGSVVRTMNYPLLAFMILGGTVVGLLAARGMADLNPLARLGFGGNSQPEANPAPAAQPRQHRRAA